MKIMTVDDSSIMRTIITNALQALGYDSIVEAVDGRDALAKLKVHNDIGVIFLDWNMPNMNGIKCLKEIRANTNYDNIKVIMATTEAEKKNVFVAIQNGASDYILKPFTPKTIKEKLDRSRSNK